MDRLNRRAFLRTCAFAGAMTLTETSRANEEAMEAHGANTRPNVLFVAVDDLRPQLGCYGKTEMKTPNLDVLAARGVIFERAYCQQAICNPSRTSLLTGRRPDSTRVHDLVTHFRDTIPDATTLPQHFKAQGYHTQAFGKVYHGNLDDLASWSAPLWKPDRNAPDEDGEPGAKKTKRDKAAKRASRGASWEASGLNDDELPDGQIAMKAIEALRTVRAQPFFLAVGFMKPHLPFIAPKKYYDLYPPETIQTSPHPFPPSDAPKTAMTNYGELRNYADIPSEGPIPEEKARELIRGYCAATSYTDAQIGRVMTELDRLGLRENTVVIVWGDHGWHLGDLGQWCKHTNFEVATRSPLIVSAPGMKAAGAKSPALVEFVDIYPSLCQLCGLNPPDGLEGTSFAPLLDEPDRAWKRAAFSQYPRSGGVMGYSMRTDQWRYTEWLDKERQVIGIELYDHQADNAETCNLALREDYHERITQLSNQLRAGWREALPAPR